MESVKIYQVMCFTVWNSSVGLKKFNIVYSLLLESYGEDMILCLQNPHVHNAEYKHTVFITHYNEVLISCRDLGWTDIQHFSDY